MRDYSKISPKFWIGATGKKLRAAGMEAQIVSMYLMTCPTSNMLGLFYCPITYIAHETGLGMEGASKGLTSSIEAGFCLYDDATEMVWVMEMAEYQIAPMLKPADKRCDGVQNEYNSLPENPYLARFFDKYSTPFNMTKRRGYSEEMASPLEAPSKPLASQEQEQEQEQDIKALANDDVVSVLDPVLPASPDCPHEAIVALYHETLPALPRVAVWDERRRTYLRSRWRESQDRQSLDWWKRLFGYVGKSDFLMGRVETNGRKPFQANLEWILKPSNFVKIIEGNYES